ncbi:cytochrome P450 [Arthrobacter sp. Sr33]
MNEEAGQLMKDADARGELVWDDFIETWDKVVRRVVFGDAAREDHELTDMITELRSDANWAFLKPVRKKLRTQFLAKARDRMLTADARSLAHIMANTIKKDGAAPANQIPQWLFVFDPAGMATFRTLAALSTQERTLDRARQEISEDTSNRKHLPYLRACVLEALRLWPTTPLTLRQTTREVSWHNGTIPKNCGVLIHAPFFHRDERHLPGAHRFEPGRWQEDHQSTDWALVPFSDGPVVCPGRQLVLMLTSAMLAHVVESREITLKHPHPLDAAAPLPGTLNNYRLRFGVHS